MVIKIKNGIMKQANVSIKFIVHAKKIIVEILAHVFLRMVSIYKGFRKDNSKTVCDEIIYVTDIVSTSVTSIISVNVVSTMLTISNDKKVRYKMDCYILHTVLLAIILLFIIAIISYHYAKHR